MLMIPSNKSAFSENTCTRSIETHHGGDSQTSKAYPQVDRTPRNCSKHEPRSEYGTCLLVPWLNSPHSELKESRDDRNVRCRVIFCEKLPKANASEPRRHASPALSCGVEMNPDEVHGHEGPQGWVRAACHRRRRTSVVALAMPTTGSRKARTGGIGSGRRKSGSCWSIMQPRPSGAGVPEGCWLGQNCRHKGDMNLL